MATDVVLYFAHEDTPAVRREVSTLRAQLDARYDIVVVGYCQSTEQLSGIQAAPTRAYTVEDLRTLPYPEKLRRFRADDFIGNADLVPLRFFAEAPGYAHYWICEFDVRFGGAWSSLFDELSRSSADLLCTAVQSYADNPDWAHWHSLETPGQQLPPERRLKGFTPFARLSAALLRECDAHYRAGWSGHPEVLWATIAQCTGLTVEDIGGDGRFTPPARRGRLYFNSPMHWSLFPGSFVYRPCFVDREISGMDTRFPGWLWHPVKGTS